MLLTFRFLKSGHLSFYFVAVLILLANSVHAETTTRQVPVMPGTTAQTCDVTTLDGVQATLNSAIQRANDTYARMQERLSTLGSATCPDLTSEYAQIDGAIGELSRALDQAIASLDAAIACENSALIGALPKILEDLRSRYQLLNDLKALMMLAVKCTKVVPALQKDLEACIESFWQRGNCNTPGGCIAINKCLPKMREALELIETYKRIMSRPLPIPIGSGGGLLAELASQIALLEDLIRRLDIKKCLDQYQTGGTGKPIRVCIEQPTPAEIAERKRLLCLAFSDPAIRAAAIAALQRLTTQTNFNGIDGVIEGSTRDGRISEAELREFLAKKCGAGTEFPKTCEAVKFILEHFADFSVLLAEIQRGQPSREISLSDLQWMIARLATLPGYCAPPPPPSPPDPNKNCCLCTYDKFVDDKCIKRVKFDPATMEAHQYPDFQKICLSDPYCTPNATECRAKGYNRCKESEAANELREGAQCSAFQVRPKLEGVVGPDQPVVPPPGFEKCTNLDVVHHDHYHQDNDNLLLPGYLVCLAASPNCTGIHCVATGCSRFEGPNGFSNAVDRITTLLRLYGRANIRFTACGNQLEVGTLPFVGESSCTMAKLEVDCSNGVMNVCPVQYRRCKDMIGEWCNQKAQDYPVSCVEDGPLQRIRKVKCEQARFEDNSWYWFINAYVWHYAD